jgi:hypothetical protein
VALIVRAAALLVAVVLVIAGLVLSPWPWLAPVAAGVAVGWWALTSEETQ